MRQRLSVSLFFCLVWVILSPATAQDFDALDEALLQHDSKAAESIAMRLDGASRQLALAEVYLLSRDYYQVQEMLKGLTPTLIPKGQRPRFHLLRGILARESLRSDLAEKDFNVAFKRGAPEIRYRALSRLLALQQSGASRKERVKLAAQLPAVDNIRSLMLTADLISDGNDIAKKWLLRQTIRELAVERGWTHAARAKTPDLVRALVDLKRFDEAAEENRRLLQSSLQHKDWAQLKEVVYLYRLLDYMNGNSVSSDPDLLEILAKKLPAGTSRLRADIYTILQEVQLTYEACRDSGDLLGQLASLKFLATKARKLGDFPKARRLLEEALNHPGATDNPNLLFGWRMHAHRSSLHHSLGVLEWEEGNRTKGAELMLEALRSDVPEVLAWWKVMAARATLDRALLAGDLELAVEAFDIGLDQALNLPRGFVHGRAIGLMTESLGQSSAWEKSRLSFEDGEEGNPIGQLLLSRLARDSERMQACLDDYTIYAPTEDKAGGVWDADARAEFGVFLLDLGRDAEAREVAESVVGPSNPDGTRQLAHLVLSRLEASEGDEQASLRHLTLATELASEFYQTRVGLIERLIRLEELGLAERQLEQLKENKPEDGQSAILEARLLLKRGAALEAVSVLEALLQREDLGADLVLMSRFLRARSLAQLERFEESFAEFSALNQKLVGNSAMFRLELLTEWGEALERAGQPQEALRRYRDGMEILQRLREALPYDLAQRQLGESNRVSALLDSLIQWHSDHGEQQNAARYTLLANSLRSGSDVSTDGLSSTPERRAFLRDLQSARSRYVRSDNPKGKRAELLATLNRLRSQDPQLAGLLQFSSLELTDLQNHLAEGDCLLYLTPGRKAIQILLVSRSEVFHEQVQVGSAALSRIVSEYTEHLASPSFRTSNDPRAERLYELLLKPVEDRLVNFQRVTVMPSNELWKLPLESLRDNDERHAGQRWLFSYQSRPSFRRERIKGPGAKALYVSPPKNLPGTKRELEALGRLDAVSEAQDKSQLMSLLPQCDLIHIASHGRLNTRDINLSYLQLGNDQLSLAEVYALPLKKGAVVVLSTCQSGSGQSSGSEIASLATAFLASGASTVVASKWQVDDEATGYLFEQFYQHLSKGEGVAQALRSARSQTRKKWPEPYYWSGFVVMGNH